ncbi:MAG TPA: hypothetical protein VGX03_06445 [Candidatus Binatia bacterium]|nr:hypothetical protein [Candidatus Binatia bacterium]
MAIDRRFVTLANPHEALNFGREEHLEHGERYRRGLLRRAYEGTTLRENLGLPRPQNRFF